MTSAYAPVNRYSVCQVSLGFNAMGIEAFAGRAERELLATGERVRKRSVETRSRTHSSGGTDRATRP